MTAFSGLLGSLLHDPSPAVRRRAATKLGEAPSIQNIAGLRSALGDEVSDVRNAAIVSLLRAGEPKTVGRVMKAVGSCDTDIAIEAAQLLGRAKYVPGVPRLLEVFRTAKSPVAAAIADALGEIGDRIALPILCMAIDNKFVAAAASNAVGRIGDTRGIATLLRAFEQGNPPELRAAAARALGLIRRKPPASVRPKDQVAYNRIMPLLKLALDDTERAVRVSASVALWDIGERGLPLQSIREIEEMTTQIAGHRGAVKTLPMEPERTQIE